MTPTFFHAISDQVTNIAEPKDPDGSFDKPTNKLILAIDFDGTIVEDKFPYVGHPMPKAIESLKYLRSFGVHLILWTCRSENYLNDAINFLTKNGIQVEKVNENSSILKFTTSHKIYADMYLDDRSYPAFPGWETFIHDFNMAYGIL